VFQGVQIPFDTDVNGISTGNYTWVSFWFKWPAGHFIVPFPGAPDAGLKLEPSDETLVRTRSAFNGLATYNANAGRIASYDVAIGLIAWDAGEFPGAFDLGTFNSNSSLFAPPHPIVDIDDDWILRDTYPFAHFNPAALSVNAPDSYYQSLAKRKLPPDTGILGVIGAANTIDEQGLVMDWSWDCRVAVRTGYTA